MAEASVIPSNPFAAGTPENATYAQEFATLEHQREAKAGVEFELKLTAGALEGATSVYVLQEG